MTTTQRPTRSSGVLLHPTSLPGPYGVGDLGPVAFEWVDTLAAAGQTWWQILPLGPTGYADSPYQCFSAFAGNPVLVSPELLTRDGLLTGADAPTHPFPEGHVDFGSVIPYKKWLLGRAWDRFQGGSGAALRPAFEAFCGREAAWLDEFGLFMALKDAHQGTGWPTWGEELILRKPAALARARETLAGDVGRHKFAQFLFDRQWSALKAHAHRGGVRLIGDVPIFVASDSADVWANSTLFQLDARRQPTVVAGVPPDYFSPTGQLWGNPHYDWAAMKRTGYAWWVARMKKALEQVDLVRLDHFRGFAASWEVPAGQPTAEVGRWAPGPGADLLRALKAALGGLPLIAEDLGVITPDVEKLRTDFALPGMRILHFAFTDPDNRFLPHHYEADTVAYTGTHDNDTTVGWYTALPREERAFLDRYLPGTGRDIAWEMIRVALGSVADRAITPVQDLLSLPSHARMNYPGKPAGNWGWRFTAGQLRPDVMARLADLTALYARAPLPEVTSLPDVTAPSPSPA